MGVYFSIYMSRFTFHIITIWGWGHVNDLGEDNYFYHSLDYKAVWKKARDTQGLKTPKIPKKDKKKSCKDFIIYLVLLLCLS